MSMQMVSIVAIAAASGLWTANDPFVGKWKLDVSRSVIVDQMAVENPAPNKYTFRFEGGPAETILADGTDQAALPGTTLSVKADGSRSLRVIRKQKGRVVVSAVWKLSEDGQILRDAFTTVQPDGSTISIEYVYRRISGISGFAGTWESTTRPLGLKFEQQIQPYDGEGLSFVSQGPVKSITFDGRDHLVASGTKGLVASGRRRSDRAMKFTEKSGGKVIDKRALELSPDGKTLTIRVDKAGQATSDILVFERE